MTKKFECRNIGMDCGFSVEASSTEELMPKIAEHARTAHSIAQIDDATKTKVMAAIKEE